MSTPPPVAASPVDRALLVTGGFLLPKAVFAYQDYRFDQADARVELVQIGLVPRPREEIDLHAQLREATREIHQHALDTAVTERGHENS